MKIAISSGHGKHVSGAAGSIDEVTEARRVVDRVAEIFPSLGADVVVFHDDDSTDQSDNLQSIVDFHNDQSRDVDVSVHFNAYQSTTKPMGTECLYVTQDAMASRVALAISRASGLINRGGKYRGDLYFLNETDEPAILIEVCFVDSTADVAQYDEHFENICTAIAEAITGETSDSALRNGAALG